MKEKPSNITVRVVPSEETIDFDAWVKEWAVACIQLARQQKQLPEAA